jgi:hypothetical protein
MQRFGDRVAGTLVVPETPLAAPDDPPWNHQKYNSFAEYPAITMRLRRAATLELVGLVCAALRRRNEQALRTTRDLSRVGGIPANRNRRIPDELVELHISGNRFGQSLPKLKTFPRSASDCLAVRR